MRGRYDHHFREKVAGNIEAWEREGAGVDDG
jgi:hypothetical protein